MNTTLENRKAEEQWFHFLWIHFLLCSLCSPGTEVTHKSFLPVSNKGTHFCIWNVWTQKWGTDHICEPLCAIVGSYVSYPFDLKGSFLHLVSINKKGTAPFWMSPLHFSEWFDFQSFCSLQSLCGLTGSHWKCEIVDIMVNMVKDVASGVIGVCQKFSIVVFQKMWTVAH